VDAGAVPAQDVFRLELPEAARRAEPKEWMDADCFVGRGEIADRSERVRHDEHAPLRLPEGDLLPNAVPDDSDETAALAMSAELYP
jgi:hypothetical protein